MRRSAKASDLGRVGDDLFQPVGSEGAERDGGRAVDAAQRPVHVLPSRPARG